MLKITIEIKENKGKESCNVKLINPKDLSKGTQAEKNACITVINEITKSLKQIQD